VKNIQIVYAKGNSLLQATEQPPLFTYKHKFLKMARTKLANPVRRNAEVGKVKVTKAPKDAKPEASSGNSAIGVTQVVSLKKRKKRWRPGTVALRQIREQQRETKPALPLATFKALVQEVARNMSLSGDIRISKSAYPMLQAAGEDYLVELFRGAQIRAIDQGKVTVNDKHLRREARAEDKVRTRLLATTMQSPLG
tara:strand:- start:213 stop:800 length:588 start_codon:yes stop_codon:yes gene_type:complete